VEKVIHDLFPLVGTLKKPRFFTGACRRIRRRITLSTACQAGREARLAAGVAGVPRRAVRRAPGAGIATAGAWR